MRRPLALVVVLVLTLGPAAAQLPPSLPPTPLDPILAGPAQNATALAVRTAGQEFSKEEVDVKLNMEFRDVDFDTVNVIFGGGSFQARARITAVIDMRVISGSRIQGALDGAAPGSGNLTVYGADLRRAWVPADAFRATFAGEALKAFQDEQEERVADFITATVPNVTVLDVIFSWQNTSAEASLENREPPADPSQVDSRAINDPTEPPLTLTAIVDVEYLERTSLLTILDKAFEGRSEAEKARKARVVDAATSYERGAFSTLGITQVLDLKTFPGWNMDVTVTLPEGYTFEDASPDVDVADDLRMAQAATLGREASQEVLNPVALTLSNRFLVSTALLATILLVGAILRFPATLAANAMRRRLR